MRYLLHLFVAAILFATSAVASERVVLESPGAGPTLAATPEAAAGLQSLRRAAAASGTLRVIVGLKVPFAPEARLNSGARAAQRLDIATANKALLARFASGSRAATARSFATIPFVALEASPADIARLAADPSVASITEDIKLRANLAESGPLVQAPQAWAKGFSGDGQTIAVLDTGIDASHPFLAGKVVAEACYSIAGLCPGKVTATTAPGSGAPCPVKGACNHGTHVAGIAAGKGTSFSGIAKDASLIAIQVFSPDPDKPGDVAAWFSDILAGLERVYELRGGYSIAAVNISIGGDRFSKTCDRAYPAMTAAIGNLASAGIATVISSGNEASTNGTAFPACISSAISVGAVSDSNWGLCYVRKRGTPTAVDKVACYSNTASYLRLLAPGSPITSSIPGGEYDTWHGTSMAAPHVAGAWAVLKQRYPTASVSDILTRLQKTGTKVSDYRRPKIVTPRINVASALDYVAPIYTLSYAQTGTGSGTVSFAPAGASASCTASCTQNYSEDTVVRLTATPAANARFMGWSGACKGKRSCVITMTSAKSVTANFRAR